MIPHITLAERVKRYASGTYWSGHECVELRVPWFTPGSLDALLGLEVLDFLREASVLELGSGGSTLFWQDVAKTVHSYETSEFWFRLIRPLLDQKKDHVLGLLDLSVHSPFQKMADNYIKDGMQFDVLVVDGDPKEYKRGEAAHHLLRLMKPKAIVVSDNYYLPDSIIPDFQVPSDWTHIDFNDKHWHGCGTRLSFRGF